MRPYAGQDIQKTAQPGKITSFRGRLCRPWESPGAMFDTTMQIYGCCQEIATSGLRPPRYGTLFRAHSSALASLVLREVAVRYIVIFFGSSPGMGSCFALFP